jgi:hypothetical protein
MDLIERYVAEVGRHLPRDQRADVQTELRSLLQDMVEDRAQTKVDKADEAVIMAVLLEMGHPEKVAASYQTRPQYLIGPQLFPIFKLVVTVVAVVLTAVTLFGVVLSAWNSDALLADTTRLIVQAIPDVVGALFSAFGSIAIVFAILERVIPESELTADEEEAWDPRKLPAVDNAREMKRGELIAGIVFGLIFLLLLNAFPQWAGIIVMHDEQVMTVPLFSANFYANLLPWANLLLLVSIAVDVYKLRFRWQTRTTLLLDIGVNLLTAVVVYIFMVNGPVLGINTTLAQATDFSQDGIDLFAGIFAFVERIALPLILITQFISIAQKGYQLWQLPKNEAPPTLAGKMG